MAIDTTIIEAQEEFIESYEDAINIFVEQTEESEKEDSDTLIYLGGLIVADYWLQDLLMQQAISRYMFRIDSVLDDLLLFGSINEAQLASFRLAQENLITSYTLSLGEKVKLEVIRGIASGLSGTDVKELISRNYFLRSTSVTTFIQTQIADYANLVTVTQSRNAPPNTEYVFVNPLDEKTRHLCVKMVSFGSMTKQEIESSFPGAFLDRGGPNCRGYWEVSANIKNNDRKKAQNLFNGLQDKYNSKNRKLNIKTQKEYYEERQNG